MVAFSLSKEDGKKRLAPPFIDELERNILYQCRCTPSVKIVNLVLKTNGNLVITMYHIWSFFPFFGCKGNN